MLGRDNVKKLVAVSAVAVAAICGFEGYREYAYKDVAGVPTIGYGTTKNVKIGDKTTRQEAKAFLVRDASGMAKQMQSLIKVPLFQHEWDAYLSFTYNVGIGNFRSSTLLKKLNAGDYAGACAQLKRWVYAGYRTVCTNGKCIKVRNKPKGLVNRREAEYRMCMGQ